MPKIVHIPTSSTLASYTQRTTLDGVEYVLRFEWMERSSSWFVKLSDREENELTGFIPITLELDLLRLHHSTEGVPRGPLIALDHSDTKTRPGFAELGGRVRLVYVEGT